MLCEKCSSEIEPVTCGHCGNKVVALGDYCYCCGSSLHSHHESSASPMRTAEGESSDTIDFANRILCSDGACIGVIDEKGVCKVCGKPYVPES
jgi:hypothetical protein